jgi:hypothetical protein
MESLQKRGDDFEGHAEVTEESSNLFQAFILVEFTIWAVFEYVRQLLDLFSAFVQCFLQSRLSNHSVFR